MKTPFNHRALPFDGDAINATIRSALTSAGLDMNAGPMAGVMDTLRRTLSPAGKPVTGENVVDVAARFVDAAAAPERVQASQPSRDAPQRATGSFDAFEYANRAGCRAYKLYVPATIGTSPPAMVVMLHGCTQSADDFAAGTRMNDWADRHGFLVVYPEQASTANASKCWNWFKAEDQLRDNGEPSLMVGMVREVAARHGVDMQRIFVVGFSAGAAMAVILGETYPELFAGVGAHSGLPYRSAHDIPSALAAMKGGRSGMAGNKATGRADPSHRKVPAHAVPTIVFHGDRDHTVQHANGIEIAQQAKDAHAAAEAGATMGVSMSPGSTPAGRKYSRTLHADAAGLPLVESWTLHGAGHAWAGGSASGSYTDASGPDASGEMVRFFLSLPPTRAAGRVS